MAFDTGIDVNIPLMPKGVWHASVFYASGMFTDGKYSFDAERRLAQSTRKHLRNGRNVNIPLMPKGV